MSGILHDRQVDAANPDSFRHRRLKIVAFDFDGTLADSFGWLVSAINALARKHHFSVIQPDAVPRLRRMSHREVISKLGVSGWRVPLIARDLRRLMGESLGEIGLFPDVGSVLKRLSETYKLAIVSSNSIDNVKTVLGDELLACVSCLDCGISLQGKSTRLLRLVQKERCMPQEVLFVGDEVRDIEAAKQGEVCCAAVTWGYNDRDTLLAYKPDYLFDCAEELEAGLQRLA